MRAREHLPALALVAALALAACEIEDPEPELEPEPEPEPAVMTLDLAEVEDSGIHGTVEITSVEDMMTVRLNLQGLEAETSYPAHIHEGTCEEGGPPVMDLTAVEGREDGTGTSTTEVDKGELDPDARHFIQAHLADGTPAACVDVKEDRDRDRDRGDY